MEFKYLLCGLLGVVFLPSIAHSDVTLTTPSHHTKPIGEDHLLSVLTNMHHSHTFSHLGTNEKIMLVELLAAAEVDAVTHYIDTVGFSKFLLLIDAITKINATEAHLLEQYMIQELNQENPGGSGQSAVGRRRSLTDILTKAHQNPVVQTLSAEDQALLDELLRAAESHTLTPVIHREGYAKIIQLFEDIGSQHETHLFITYLVNHMNEEAAMHG
uniref:Uncharacterized protein LOC111111173 n=1 Tax=Crassostrea virginica TaxID=6565 RepID=A0A8B8BLI3_CRAVI|nr:uncharacterized protein LOC111111173 [Crassostrea virginica]